MASPWLRHGFWNTMEHGVTRVADAATTLILLWVLSPETFSKLAVAQAVVAPLLFFFVCPENVIYRDFARWKSDGPNSMALRLRVFRTFAWGKGQLALIIAFLVAFLVPGTEEWTTRFFALIWAFSLALAPQLTGADREFLRLDLKMRELSVLTLYQKVSLLLGTTLVALAFPVRVDLLSAAALFSTMTSAWLVRWRVFRVLREWGADPKPGLDPAFTVAVLGDSMKTYTMWSHLTGVVQNWVQTMDLFFLGVLRFPAREVGLYAAALKLANFSLALPNALSNLFAVWVGRRTPGEGEERERREVRRLTAWMFVAASIQALVIAAIAPWLVSLLSHGRWTPEEQNLVWVWLLWILGGGVVMISSVFITPWLALRGQMRDLFLRVYFPWVVISLGVYGAWIQVGGLGGAAMANSIVALSFFGLLAVFAKRVGRL